MIRGVKGRSVHVIFAIMIVLTVAVGMNALCVTLLFLVGHASKGIVRFGCEGWGWRLIVAGVAVPKVFGVLFLIILFPIIIIHFVLFSIKVPIIIRF
jgi:hypothetical protein